MSTSLQGTRRDTTFFMTTLKISTKLNCSNGRRSGGGNSGRKKNEGKDDCAVLYEYVFLFRGLLSAGVVGHGVGALRTCAYVYIYIYKCVYVSCMVISIFVKYLMVASIHKIA